MPAGEAGQTGFGWRQMNHLPPWREKALGKRRNGKWGCCEKFKLHLALFNIYAVENYIFCNETAGNPHMFLGNFPYR